MNLNKDSAYDRRNVGAQVNPHGARRETTWEAALLPIRPVDTPRGFTGHEHLDVVGIIHMNGRIYDPELGRMLSPDPNVPDPTITQEFNRYAYVRNNPLSYTDPSGFALFNDDGSVAEFADGSKGRGHQGGSDHNYDGRSTWDKFKDFVFGNPINQLEAKRQAGIRTAVNSYLRNVSHIATANHRIRIAATVGARSKWMGAKQRALAEIESLDLFTKEDVDEFERHLAMREAASVAGMALSFRKKGALASSTKVATAEAQATFKSGFGSKPANLSPQGAGRRGAFREAKRSVGIPVSQQPSKVSVNKDRRGNIQPGKSYEFEVKGTGKTKVIRDDAGGHNFGTGNSQNRGPHFNNEKGDHFDY